VGKFAFLQVAAPSRSSLEEYRRSRNASITSPNASTAVSRTPLPAGASAGRAHDHDAVNEVFVPADACMVTSLHDGIEPRCKEFAPRATMNEVFLILSRFAGCCT